MMVNLLRTISFYKPRPQNAPSHLLLPSQASFLFLCNEDNTSPSPGCLEINLPVYGLIYADDECHKKDFWK